MGHILRIQQCYRFLNEWICKRRFTHLDKHLLFLQKRGGSVQPFVISVGDNKFEAEEYSYFLYVDQHLLPFTDFQRVFDTCFKSFYLFKLDFWTFIQICFFII